MSYTLNLAELFACAVLTRTRFIHGMDLEAEIPKDVAERQRLYERGEKLLMERGLLRDIKPGVAQLEQRFLSAVRCLMAPDYLLLSLLNDPMKGQAVLVHCFDVSGTVVEFNRNPGNGFRLMPLAQLGLASERIAEQFGPGADSQPELAGDLPMAELGQMLASVQARDVASALKRLRQGHPESAFVDQFAETLGAVQRHGTVSRMIGKDPSGRNTKDIVIVQGRDLCWAGMPNGPETCRLATVNRRQLIEILNLAAQLT